MNIISKIEFTSDDFPGADLATLDITKEEIESLAQAKELLLKNDYESIIIKVPFDAITLSQYNSLSSMAIDRPHFEVVKQGVYFGFRAKLDSTATYRTKRLIIARGLSEEVLIKLKEDVTDAFSSLADFNILTEYSWASSILDCVDKNGDPSKLINDIISKFPLEVSEKLVHTIQSLYI